MTSTSGATDDERGSAMWSDNEANIDLLRFGYLAAEVAEVVTTEHLLPVTVGIYGDWGGGKSTLIRMVRDALDGCPKTMTLQFNGWLFEGYEDAKTALMGSILDAIEERLKADETLLGRGHDLLTKLIRRVNWMHLVGLAGRYAAPIAAGVPHLAVANLAQDVPRLLQSAETDKGPISVEDAKNLITEAPDGEANLRRNLRDFRRDFATLLEQSEIETLVVFIDDLDRCLPDTIIDTLEAIKLFLFVPGTAFVIGADERLVQYAVRQRFPELPGTEAEVGRDYLEKLVQVPIRVPPLGSADFESYMNLLFAERRLPPEVYKDICQAVTDFRPDNVADLAFDVSRARALLPDGVVPDKLQEDLDLVAQVVPVLAPGLGGNPRRAKRFLNALLLRLSLARRRGLELERRILAKLMLLEYIRPEFFRTLADLQGAGGGRPRALTEAEVVLRAPRSSANANSTADPSGPGASSNGVERDAGRGSKRGPKATAESDDTSRALPEDAVPAEVQPWLADPWTREWLAADPPLGDVDLGPYFFIAHDRIGALASTELRLSPVATEVLNRLLSQGGPSQEVGLRRAADLGTPDAIAIFQNLAQRIRRAEILDDRSPQGILFKLMDVRPELLPQLVSLYSSLPETKITAATPPLLIRITKDKSAAEATRGLVDRWSRSSRGPLSNAARSALRRA